MAKTSKMMSSLDGNQTLQGAYNDVDGSITVDGYLVGKVNRRIALAVSTTNVSNDTETYTFSEASGATVLYALQVVYTDGTRETMLYAERIS